MERILEEQGLQKADVTNQWLIDNIRKKHCQKMELRDMKRLWHQYPKACQRIEDLELGTGGGKRKKGQHSVLRQTLSMGVRTVKPETANKKSALHTVFAKVKTQFEQWRMAGQYVDKDDIFQEFEHRLKTDKARLEKIRDGPTGLESHQVKLLGHIESRLKSHEKSAKSRESSITQMMKLFRCRFLKPQRLIHLSLDQECERLLETWAWWDKSLHLAAFEDLEKLKDQVVNPDDYRKHVRKTVIAMSDQMPFWIKLVPGKQLYLPGEFQKTKKKLTEAEKNSQLGGSASQSTATAINAEGMTQTRGSSHSEQDKFRITVDTEQVLYGFFDETQKPVADLGITSVIFTGSHFNAQNVSEDRTWLSTDTAWINGAQKTWEAGKPVEHGLGSALLKFRDDHPKMWKDMQAFGFRFYQQPAGFEDAIITKWKIQEQSKVHGQTLAVRDLFTGALAESSRMSMMLNQQLSAWIRSKITAIVQVADTHVIRPVKIRKLQKDVELRRQLIKLSELEKTAVVFKCGLYEIMKSLYEVFTELGAEWKQSQYLLKGMYQNGWLSMRPSMSQNKLVRTEGQEWCEGFKLGSHRLQKSWVERRFEHISEDGIPMVKEIQLKMGETEDTEQTYSTETPQKEKTLECWKLMLASGEISKEDLAEMTEEAWFEHEVLAFTGLEGIDEFKELLKTPAQRRMELGIDVHLTSQRNKTLEAQKKKRTRALEKQQVKALRGPAAEEIRKLRADGYSVEAITAKCIKPVVGKGKAAKKKLRDSMAAALAKKKLEKKVQGKDKNSEVAFPWKAYRHH